MKKTKQRKRKQTPSFPSKFKIGQAVNLNFHLGGKITVACRVSGVSFDEYKVYYDIDIPLYPASSTENSNTILRTKTKFVTIYRVDSICVESI